MEEEAKQLLIDRETSIQRPSDQQIRQWASNKRVFISSTMTDLADVRQSVANTVTDLGAQPVMFELLGARTDDSRQAYTSEVRRSHIHLGILSRRYGDKLESGYSATHEEYEEARKHRKEILLFLDDDVSDAERDGHLNTWLRELYKFHVLRKYSGVEDLTQWVTASLADIASDQVTPWIKIGHVIFQVAKIEVATQGHETRITVTTPTHDPHVAAEITRMAQEQFQKSRRLSFRNESFETRIASMNKTIDTVGNDSLVLVCEAVDDRYKQQPSIPLLQMGGSFQDASGIRYDHHDLIQMAIRDVALAERPPVDLLFSTHPPIDFKSLIQQCGGDIQLFPKIAQLLIVEKLHEHGIVSALIRISMGKVREGRVSVYLSVTPPQIYTDMKADPIEVEGEIHL